MLLPRFLTALIGLPLILAGIWWGQVPFFLMMFGVAVLALYEFLTLAEEADWPVFKRLGLACGGFLVFSMFLFGTRMSGGRAGSEYFTPAALTAILFTLVFFALFRKQKEDAFLGMAVTWLGLFYVAWALSHLILIRDLRPDGRLFTFFLFIVVWALDIGAYGGGKKFGRSALAESVSPKKTWEGVVVGSASALLAAWICRSTFLTTISAAQALLLAAAIAVLAQLGDLSESLFKRNVRVKDSGDLLPGHGGLLDRFDSFLLAAPAYYYLLVLVVRP